MKVLQKFFHKLQKRIHLDFIHHSNKKVKFIYIISFLFICISCIMQLLLLNHPSPVLVSIINILILILYLLTMLFNLRLSNKLQHTAQDLKSLKLHNKSLKTSHDDVRAFKHDFSNIIQALGGYIVSNDMEGLKIYYSQLFNDCQKLNSLYSLSPDVINNPAVYSILSSKYNKADALGITVQLNIFLDLNTLYMNIYEFSRILGILMDNAIEAACMCDEKIINVEIRKDIIRNRQLLIIENTYLEKDLDLEHIFQKGVSSKPHNTGIGLWEVRQILKKTNNLNLHTSKDDYFFKQQLELYPKTNKVHTLNNKERKLVKI